MPDFKEERTQKFTSLVFTLIAIAFFGMFAINPTIGTIAKLGKELEDNIYIDQQLQTKINNLSLLQQSYSSLENDLSIVYGAIPQNPEIPNLVGQIQAVAKNNNLTVTGIQVSEMDMDKEGIKKYTSFNFNFSADGTLRDISGFVSEVVTLQRIISVNVISISQQGDEGLLRLALRGTGYFKK